jgi:sortase (surface protein transpeptidase)
VPVACPADPTSAEPTQPTPVSATAGAAVQRILSWLDRREPLPPAVTVVMLLSAAILLFTCGRAIWHSETQKGADGVAVELTQFRAVTDPPRPAAPVRVRIPAIGVNARLERLGKNPDDTVQVPRHPDRAGWFTGGPRPGEPGSAVLLGHYDSTCCPAVFYRLAALRPGDLIRVERADGSSVVFRVSRIGQYRTTRFPVRDVYFPTLRPQLRLITCAGPYQRSLSAYRDNTVVFAEQLDVPMGENRAASG